MNTIGKIFFWIFAIGLGFVNSCNEQVSSEMNSFSEDILEKMK